MRKIRRLVRLLLAPILCLILYQTAMAGAKEGSANGTRRMVTKPPFASLPPGPLEGGIMSAVFNRYADIDRKEVMDFIEREFPEDRQRFTVVAMGDQAEATGFLSGLVRQTIDLLALKKTKPAVYEKALKQKKLERKAVELGDLYRQAQGDDKEQVLKDLHGVLAESFDLKQDLMKGDVARMEQHLNELKLLLQKREVSRQAIIECRAGELTGEKGVLEW